MISPIGCMSPTSFFFTFTLLLSSFWTGRGHRCRPLLSPRFLPSIFIAHRAQQSHCSSIFIRVLLTQALALSASQFVHKKKSPRIYTSYALRGARTHETDLHIIHQPTMCQVHTGPCVSQLAPGKTDYFIDYKGSPPRAADAARYTLAQGKEECN